MTELTRSCPCGALLYHPPGKGRWLEHCEKCLHERQLKRQAAYRDANRVQIRATARVRAKAERAKNPEPSRVANRKFYQATKTKVLGHYGHQCACCGSAEHLSIDHINGKGAEHREELYGSARLGTGTRFYLWLIQHGFPAGYQTLCLPCNRSKGDGPRCQLNHTVIGR